MKNSLTFLLAVCSCIIAVAQPRSIGGKLGYGIEASYQHSVGSRDNFVEAGLGLSCFHDMNIASTYNFMIAKPAWTEKGQWGFYAGPGAEIATNFRAFAFGIGGQIGLEYIFESTPLQLSFDWRPMFGPIIYNGSAIFWDTPVYNFTISARYVF